MLLREAVNLRVFGDDWDNGHLARWKRCWRDAETGSGVNIFVKRVVRDRKIPFELSADPFYCESNMRYLAESAAAARAGHVTEHELIKS